MLKLLFVVVLVVACVQSQNNQQEQRNPQEVVDEIVKEYATAKREEITINTDELNSKAREISSKMNERANEVKYQFVDAQNRISRAFEVATKETATLTRLWNNLKSFFFGKLKSQTDEL
jgi:hypothetical protein